jgi:hypothetical protein
VAYLNQGWVKRALGVDDSLRYKLCSDVVEPEFSANGQTGLRTDAQVSYLLNQVSDCNFLVIISSFLLNAFFQHTQERNNGR